MLIYTSWGAGNLRELIIRTWQMVKSHQLPKWLHMKKAVKRSMKSQDYEEGAKLLQALDREEQLLQIELKHITNVTNVTKKVGHQTSH